MNTNKLAIITFAIGLGAAGCGTDVTSSASGVFPAEGFAGRSLRVEISGDQTSWKDGATVDLGAGITVNTVEVASPTDLFADITIDPTTATGPTDVTVNSGGKFTLKQAFVVTSPIEIQIQGTVAQGSLGIYKIINHDFDNPFDATASTDPNTGATVYPNFSISSPAGVDFMSQLTTTTVSAYEVDGLVLIDTDAASGAVTVTSGPQSKQLTSVSSSVTVAARTGTAATGMQTGMITTAYDAQLFTLPSGTNPSLDQGAVTTSSQAGAPNLALLGPSGHWSDFISLGSPYGIQTADGPAYAIVYDLSGASAYSFTLTSAVDPLAIAGEGADATNGTINGAGVLTASGVPFMQTGGTLSSASDADIIKVVVAAGSPMIGKVFHVTTTLSQDPFTELSVNVTTGASGTTSISGGPVDADTFSCIFGGVCGAEFTTSSATPIAAGTYYFTVAAGSAWTSSDTSYDILFFAQ